MLLIAALAFLAQIQETITVERILVDAHVTDAQGDPILGLTPDDFRVRIDGRKAVVESVDWIPESVAAREMAGIDDEEKPPGRLLVVFLQTDLARNDSRIAGQMNMLKHADELLEWLDSEDRVAVFSFDSHLKFRLDFTNNMGDVRAAMQASLAMDDPAPPRIVPRPALASRLDPKAMRDTTNSEQALILIANALRPIEGPKSLILLGWGLGRRIGSSVVMDPKYPIARRALEASRVTIYSLDTTKADYHDLEIGLRTASADTGGFYAKTHDFPRLAIERLRRTLAGHYEVEVRKPATKVVGTHTIDVEVTRRGAIVLARTTYVD